MTSRRNVVSFYTAPARSGKTFRMVVRIVDEILPRTEGMIYTNLPLHVDRIAEYCADRHGMDPDEVRDRLQLIPREVEESWRDAGRPIYDAQGRRTGAHPLDGPWEYLAEKPLSGSTIIIDEIHNFCGSIGTPKPVSNKWQKWLGELGHNQAIFICISQAPEKVHACIKQEAQASYTIRNTGLDRDPYFHIEFYDWLELWSGLFGGEYRIFVFEQETQKIEGKKVRGERNLCLMGQPYFSLYDSFNKPIDGDHAANGLAFQKRVAVLEFHGIIKSVGVKIYTIYERADGRELAVSILFTPRSDGFNVLVRECRSELGDHTLYFAYNWMIQ